MLTSTAVTRALLCFDYFCRLKYYFKYIFGFLLILVISNDSLLAQTSWKGTTNTSWRNSTNWTNGVPSATVDAIIGDVNFTGSFQPTISKSATCKSLTIGTASKACSLTIYSSLAVKGNIVLNSNGTIVHNGSVTVSIAGNWTNNGTYTTVPSGNKYPNVVFSGTSQTISGPTTFRILTISASSTTTLNSNITVSRTFSVNGIFDPNDAGYLVTLTGASFFVNASATLRVKSAIFTSNYSINPTLNSTSIVDYSSSTVNQTITILNYGTLQISGALVKTLSGNTSTSSTSSISGNVNIIAGTLDLSIYSLNRLATGGGSFTIGQNAKLKIGGTGTFPSNYTAYNIGTVSTVEYYGTNQAISSKSYGNLIFSSSSGAAVKTMPAVALTISNDFESTIGSGTSVSFTALANIQVNGNTTFGASTTFNGSSFNHTFSGNLTVNGLFTGSTSTITMTGTNKTISGSGTINFNNLTVTGYGLSVTSLNPVLTGNLTTISPGTLSHVTGGTFTMSGASKVISGSNIIFESLSLSGSISTTSSFTINYNLTVNGSLNATAGTIIFSGTGRTITGTGTITLYGLKITGTVSTTKNMSIRSDVSGLGKFTATSGTVTFIGTSTYAGTHDFFNVILNGTKLQLGSTSNLGIGGALTLTAGVFDVTTSVPNTVNYNISGTQTITATTYNNLSLSTGGTKNAGGAIVVNNTFTIGTGTTFSSGANTLTLLGNWVNNGAFSAGSGTVQLTGTLDASISGATTFNILTINKSTSSNFILLNNNISVATVNMTSGEMRTGVNAVTITTTRTGNGIILGTITRTHLFLSNTVYAFEGPYNTINFNLILGFVTSITVKVTSASVDGFPLDGSINRVYNINLTSLSAYSATVRLHYLDSELNGNTESSMTLWQNSSAWANMGKSSNDASNNYVEQTSVSNIADRWTLSNVNTISIWKGSVSTSWENAGNWKSGVLPAPTDVIQIGYETFTNQPQINSTVTTKAFSFGSTKAAVLTLGSSSSLTVNGNIRGTWTANAIHSVEVGSQSLNVIGDIVTSNGVTDQSINLSLNTGSISTGGSLVQAGNATIVFNGAGNINIGNNFTYSAGTFTCGSGTVTYTGGTSQTIAGGIIYNNLGINKTIGLANMTSAITVNGNLTLSGTSVMSVNASLIVGGAIVINSGSTFEGNSETISVGGNWLNAGTFNPSLSSVIFNGNGSQSVNSTTFNNLTSDKSAGTLTLTGNLLINGNLSLTNGTMDLSTFSCNRSVAGGTLMIGTNANLKLAGAANFPSNFNTDNLSPSSTVEYNGIIPQSIEPVTYGHLVISNGGSLVKTLSAAATVAGNLTINSGASMGSGSYALTLLGNWNIAGTFVPSSGTVVLAGSNHSLNGPVSMNNLIITGNYTSTSGSDIFIGGNVDLLGSYNNGTNTITLTGDLSVSGTISNDGTVIYTGTKVQVIRLTGNILSPSLSSTNTFAGTVAPVFNSSASPTFVNVNINNTGGLTASVGWIVYGAFKVATNCTFDGGSLTHNFYGPVSNNGKIISTGTLNFIPAPPYAVTPTVALDLGSGVNFQSDGTINFGGSSQIVLTGVPGSLNNVNISNTNTGGLRPAGNWMIKGNLGISSGAQLNCGAGLNHSVGGSINIFGVLNGETSAFSIGSADTTEITGSGSINFYNLTIDNFAIAIANFTIGSNFTCNANLEPNGAFISFTGSTPSIIGGTLLPVKFSNVIIAKTISSTTLSQDISIEQDITINSGATFLGDTKNIYLEGDWINNGIFSETVPASTLNLRGSEPQEIGGTSVSIFGHVTVDNSSGVSTTSAQTIAGNLTLQLGVLSTNNYLTLDLTTGAIAGTGGGSLNGTLIAKRIISASSWHYIATPLTGVTYAEINDDYPLSTNSMYYYNEILTGTSAQRWKKVNPNALNTPIESMEGYAIKIPTAQMQIDFTGNYTHGSATSFNASISYNNHAAPLYDGWHVVGNPYPSYIDWTSAGCVKNNLAAGISYYNAAVGANADYIYGQLPPASTNGASPYIPPMQAFWVKANPTGSLTINNSARVINPNLIPYSSPSFYRKAASEVSTLKLVAGNGAFQDETIVRFASIATEALEDEFDMKKTKNDGSTPSFYSQINGIDYSINTLDDKFTRKIIPLKIEAAVSGKYKISVLEMTNFKDAHSVILEDRLLNQFVDFKIDSSYSFNLEQSDTMDRFFIRFDMPLVSKLTDGLDKQVNITSDENDIIISLLNMEEGNTNISLFNVLGQKEGEVTLSPQQTLVRIPMNKSGCKLYVVNVNRGTKYYSKNIIVK